MIERNSLRAKTYVLLTLMVCFGSVGDVTLSRGMKQVGQIHAWSIRSALPFFERAFSNGTIWLGIILLLSFFVSYMLVLSWADFSYVSPASAVGYVLVALMGYFFLGEHVPVVRWVGVGLICVGVLIVGGTSPDTGKKGA